MTYQEKTIYRGKIQSFNKLRQLVSLTLVIDGFLDPLVVILYRDQPGSDKLYAMAHEAFHCDLRCAFSYHVVNEEKRLLTFEV